MADIIIVGGGLAGLINAILLARHGMEVILFEKNDYPQHRVCGEYISNEVRPFLIRNGLYPGHLVPNEISQFTLTSVNGRSSVEKLDLGGFGVSRYALDDYLFHQAKLAGASLMLQSPVDSIHRSGERFRVTAGTIDYESKMVIGAHGKRAKLDGNLGRHFVHKRSPYVGVKYHLTCDYPDGHIALHNFKNGYCGISNVEGGTTNLCYLTHRDNLKRSGSIEEMEKSILYQNPFLKDIFANSEKHFEKPLVINEVMFEPKPLVEDGVLMCGDSAGMIAPLCGNGMAMAIRSAHMLSTIIVAHWEKDKPRHHDIQRHYQQAWQSQFAIRLMAGRQIQRMFGSVSLSNVAVMMMGMPSVARPLIKLTHGDVF